MENKLGHEDAVRNEFARATQGVGGMGFDHLFSIRDYVRNIARHWRLFLLAAVVGFVWAVHKEATAPKLYSVSVVVGPVGDSGPTGGTSGLVSLFLSGGSMAAGPPDWGRYVFALSSVRLAEKLQRDHHLLQTVFASRWDSKTKTWKPSQGREASVERFFERLFGFPVDPPPDVKALAQYISATVTLSTDKTTGISTLSTLAADPKKGLAFILMVHQAAVDLVRAEIAQRNDAKIDFVLNSLRKTTNADQRGVLISMLAQTEQTQMLLNNHLPFASQIIDTPTVPQDPSSPRALQVLLMYYIGFLAFVILFFIAIDQIADTNIVEYAEAKITGLPHALSMRLSRFREYGWHGLFSRS
jgi:hypothetical protein